MAVVRTIGIVLIGTKGDDVTALSNIPLCAGKPF